MVAPNKSAEPNAEWLSSIHSNLNSMLKDISSVEFITIIVKLSGVLYFVYFYSYVYHNFIIFIYKFFFCVRNLMKVILFLQLITISIVVTWFAFNFFKNLQLEVG